MDIGMPTLLEHESLTEGVMLCKKLQLDFIELNMNLPEFQAEKIDVAQLKELQEKEQIYFTFHLDEKMDVCDMNKKVAEAYTKTVADTIAIAKKLSVPVLNMHMSNGVYFTLPEGKVYLYSKYYNRYMNKLQKFREVCEKAIGNADIKICLENAEGFQSFARDGIDLLLESKIFGLTYDIGHNHAAKRKDEAFIKAHGNRVLHMHIHDALGKTDHLPLGQGEIQMEKKLAFAKQQNCRIVLETKTVSALEESVSKIAQYDCK